MSRLPRVFSFVLSTALSFGTVAADRVALTGATIYPSPSAAPIRNGTILVADGKVEAVGTALAVPSGTTVLDCTGLFVTAGFQNSHVHFTGRNFAGAASQSPDSLTQLVRAMLTRYGFTTVVDTGSELENTTTLRRRIESGEVAGPRILTAGTSIYPENGVPYYVREVVPPDIVRLLSHTSTGQQVVAAIDRNVSLGADVIKLFTGSLVERGKVMPMRQEIASAAVAEAHRRKMLVYTHPSNDEGLRVGIDAGVDILAHTTPAGGAWDDALVAKITAANIALTPTLKLWAYEVLRGGGPPERAEAFTQKAVRQLAAFAKGGGQVLFGTDVGYMQDFDPADEYRRMAEAGLNPMQVLASLTTAPAAKFGEAARRGRVAPGQDADLVVLEADPAPDARNFTKVRATLRAGRTIFSSR